MALRITEFFGRTPLAPSAAADVGDKRCPFVHDKCIKPNHGACSFVMAKGDPIIACPNRLYAENYRILTDISDRVFGFSSKLVKASEVRGLAEAGLLTGSEVAVFGRYWGQELPLQRPKGKNAENSGSYFMDWILARLDAQGKLAEFTAVEVQSIDTTGNYNAQVSSFLAGEEYTAGGKSNRGFSSKAGMNWENVNKRILPQLIYKGQMLRREVKCMKGLFFVCPKQVLEKVKARLGHAIMPYPISNSTITFRSYELGPVVTGEEFRKLVFVEEFITPVDEVARALTFPNNLPDIGAYEAAINLALKT